MKRFVYSIQKLKKKDGDGFSYPMNYLLVRKDGGLYHSEKFHVKWLEEEEYEQLKNMQCPFYIEVKNAKEILEVIE
ncbi:hypothetical protein ABVS18_004569 [Vibrio parahaemolyticus]|nr:hypothetical protein [Vibrio parahaemolyticus]